MVQISSVVAEIFGCEVVSCKVRSNSATEREADDRSRVLVLTRGRILKTSHMPKWLAEFPPFRSLRNVSRCQLAITMHSKLDDACSHLSTTGEEEESGATKKGQEDGTEENRIG